MATVTFKDSSDWSTKFNFDSMPAVIILRVVYYYVHTGNVYVYI